MMNLIFQFPVLNLPAEIPSVRVENRNQPSPQVQPIITGSALNDNQRGMFDLCHTYGTDLHFFRY